MSTTLFDKVIFGPVRSRRLGLSLGVNLLPTDNKLCNFNCIYCECGWNIRGNKPRFNSREEVRTLLRARLVDLIAGAEIPDVITFAGNGEPTMHPQFEQIIDDTIAIRDEMCPQTKISVLSNATMIGRQSVRRALMKVDYNLLKLDSAFDETVRLIDNPQGTYSVSETVRNMMLFNGKLIIQTMFLRGTFEGKTVDNTTPAEIARWLTLLAEIKPEKVMIYTIDRDTPARHLHKIPLEELNDIARKVEALGIHCSVSG